MPIEKREPRPEKVQEVAEIRELLGASALILTDYQGLDVKGISELRKKLREAVTSCRVVKNTLFRLAAAGTAAEPLAEGLAGPTAVVYTYDDPVAAAKALEEFGKAVKPLQIKSGLVDGHVLSTAEIQALAKIPPKQQLYAMVVGGLQSPITNLVGTLQSMIGQLVMTLQGVAEKKAATA
ncbi:MAG: 50S ribosomal protein L10 [Armatimonadetes bacterium]|nr:50S ribosomal protein L10 [Armatimonadota bacterium]